MPDLRLAGWREKASVLAAELGMLTNSAAYIYVRATRERMMPLFFRVGDQRPIGLEFEFRTIVDVVAFHAGGHGHLTIGSVD